MLSNCGLEFIQILKMNSKKKKQQQKNKQTMLLDYPVTICTVDQVIPMKPCTKYKYDTLLLNVVLPSRVLKR